VSIARFRDLCIDAVDDARMQAFWAGALGLEPVPDDGGTLDLVGPTSQHRVWINKVPEPVTVKQRIHLDVHAAALDDVLALGATPLDTESFRWDVVRDPEGGEMCVFTRDVVPAYKLYELAVDARDADAIAAWWHPVLGGNLGGDVENGWTWLDEIPGVPFESIVWANVPEPKTVKNRIHWDVWSNDLQGLLDRGATLLRGPDEDIDWRVLADPEGNEFCVFAPRT
jgi:hypothetical protein